MVKMSCSGSATSNALDTKAVEVNLLGVNLLGVLAASALFLGLMSSGTLAEERPGQDTILVALDQAKLVKLPTGTETIVIGNPAIADVAVQKYGVMVITGRAAGRTNFIALDSAGTIISESAVSVTATMLGKVVVQRGLERSSYDCAPLCLPTVSIGDDEQHFNRSIDQVGRRDGMANQNQIAPAAKK